MDFDAVFFYTTGELPLDEPAQRALMDFIRDGGGFVGSHCATDTFYQWEDYGLMLGGYFNGHPWHEKIRVKVEAPDLFDSIREGAPAGHVIQVNHPRATRFGGYMEAVGFNPDSGTFARPDMLSMEFDAIEVTNGKDYVAGLMAFFKRRAKRLAR